MHNLLKGLVLHSIQTKECCSINEYEKDRDEFSNHTQSSDLEDNELGQIISSITKEEELWINAKATKAIEIQAEINQEKNTIPLED